jgi:hypothetical protein
MHAPSICMISNRVYPGAFFVSYVSTFYHKHRYFDSLSCQRNTACFPPSKATLPRHVTRRTSHNMTSLKELPETTHCGGGIMRHHAEASILCCASHAHQRPPPSGTTQLPASNHICSCVKRQVAARCRLPQRLLPWAQRVQRGTSFLPIGKFMGGGHGGQRLDVDHRGKYTFINVTIPS